MLDDMGIFRTTIAIAPLARPSERLELTDVMVDTGSEYNLSLSTRRRDREQKKAFYMEVGVPEYWIVDPERRAITVVRPGVPDKRVEGEMPWSPTGASAPLVFDVSAMLDD